MDSNEPTPWEDINPPTALARQQERPAQSLARLQPADSTHFRNELTACLALVAPAGMTEENRRDWLAVAWGTLRHLPADLLSQGCAEARKTCDHPSKLVPTIIEATRESMNFRNDVVRDSGPQFRLAEPDYCTPEEASEILRKYGLKSRTA